MRGRFASSEEVGANLDVTPKSSQRKQRSRQARPEQRDPVQARSRIRHDAILDATARLLEKANIEDLTLSDIGRAARVSKASVHYHFPTIADIQLALGKRFNQDLADFLAHKHTKTIAIQSITWREWISLDANFTRDFFNANRAACECLLGPLLHRQIRLAARQANARSGEHKIESMRRIFDLPRTQELKRALGLYAEILDLFWSNAYLLNGRIDDLTFRESVAASVSYLAPFLPNILRRRQSATGAPPAGGQQPSRRNHS